MSTPEAKARYLAACSTQEVRAQNSDRMKNHYKEPEARAQTAKATKAARSTPESRARTAIDSKTRYADPKARARMSVSVKAACGRPEEKARKSVMQKIVWERRCTSQGTCWEPTVVSFSSYLEGALRGGNFGLLDPGDEWIGIGLVRALQFDESQV